MNELIERYVAAVLEPIAENQRSEVRTEIRGAIGEMVGQRIEVGEPEDAIRAYGAEGKSARSWPLAFLIRYTAFHTLDHAWEIQDKDLTGKVSR